MAISTELLPKARHDDKNQLLEGVNEGHGLNGDLLGLHHKNMLQAVQTLQKLLSLVAFK